MQSATDASRDACLGSGAGGTAQDKRSGSFQCTLWKSRRRGQTGRVTALPKLGQSSPGFVSLDVLALARSANKESESAVYEVSGGFGSAELRAIPDQLDVYRPLNVSRRFLHIATVMSSKKVACGD